MDNLLPELTQQEENCFLDSDTETVVPTDDLAQNDARRVLNEKATIRNRRRRQRKRALLKILKDENARKTIEKQLEATKSSLREKGKKRQQLMEREIIQMRVAQQMLLLQQQNILNRQSNIIAQQPTSFQHNNLHN